MRAPTNPNCVPNWGLLTPPKKMGPLVPNRKNPGKRGNNLGPWKKDVWIKGNPKS